MSYKIPRFTSLPLKCHKNQQVVIDWCRWRSANASTAPSTGSRWSSAFSDGVADLGLGAWKVVRFVTSATTTPMMALLDGVDAVVHLGSMSIDDRSRPILNANIGAYNLYEGCVRRASSASFSPVQPRVVRVPG